MPKAKKEDFSEQVKKNSMYIAMVVRNAMEEFHGKHLTDDQMKELNPIIRNAIYTALHAISLSKRKSAAATRYINFQFEMIPDYWEQPDLLEDYVKSLQLKH